MLKKKCIQIPNIAYLEPESDWVKTNTALKIVYFYKDELHLIEEGYQKLASSISKKMKAITNSNHLPITTPKKAPKNCADTDFPSLKSVTKALTNDTNYTSSVPHYKLALLKNVITPMQNKEYQMVGTTTITCNERTIQPTLSRVEIHNNYNRGNRIITMSPPTILTVNETKINCTTIKKILKPQLYKGVIIQQSNSTGQQPQEKK